MFSSGKFLSPIVTAGLPAPTPADAPPAAVLLLVLELIEDELPLLLALPHAARPTVSTSAAETLAVKVLNLLHRLPVIQLLLVVVCRSERFGKRTRRRPRRP